jgi:hypothetical protein
MEFEYSENVRLAHETLLNVKKSILLLQEWNEEYVFSVIKNDLAPLLEAVEYLLKITDELYLTV